MKYSDFVAGNPFDQHVETSNGTTLFETESSGTLRTGNDFEPIHWTPSSSDVGKTFNIVSEASTDNGLRRTKIIETSPVQVS